MDKFLPDSYNISGSFGRGTIGGSFGDGNFTSYGCLNTSPFTSVCMDRFQAPASCVDFKVPLVPVTTSVCSDISGTTNYCIGPTINAGKYFSADLQACWESKK